MTISWTFSINSLSLLCTLIESHLLCLLLHLADITLQFSVFCSLTKHLLSARDFSAIVWALGMLQSRGHVQHSWSAQPSWDRKDEYFNMQRSFQRARGPWTRAEWLGERDAALAGRSWKMFLTSRPWAVSWQPASGRAKGKALSAQGTAACKSFKAGDRRTITAPDKSTWRPLSHLSPVSP